MSLSEKALKLNLVKDPLNLTSQIEIVLTNIDPRIQQVIECMQERLSEPLTLTELAAWANVSPRQFERLFAAATGYCPWQYLKQLRLNKACELLRTSIANLKTIRAAVGIPDAAHFQRDFKAAFGMSPKQWQRMNCQQKNRAKSVDVVFRH